MAWKEKEYMSKIREFLLSYPDLEKISDTENKPLDSLVIEYFKTTPNNPMNPEGYALAVVGTNIINRNDDISGNTIIRKRANFQFLVNRYVQINEQRREIGDWIINFCDWINSENELKINPLLPKFSDTDYDQIIADGGMVIGSDTDQQKGTVDVFLLQLHLEWENSYPNYEKNLSNDFYKQLQGE